MTTALNVQSNGTSQPQAGFGSLQSNPYVRAIEAEVIIGVAHELGIKLPPSTLDTLMRTASPLEKLLHRESAIDRYRDAPSTTTARTAPHAGASSSSPARTPAAGSTPPAGTTSASRGGDTGGVSARGMDFLFAHEAVPGVSNHLHWPRYGSGVTLGAGYDMKETSRAQVVKDLTAVGVSPAAAEKASHGVGLSGEAARQFAAANRDLVNLTPAQERQLLQVTIKSYAEHVQNVVKVPLTQNQFDALVSFTYNEGTGALDGSTLLRKLNGGDTVGAARELPRWNKSDGGVVDGLVNRRADEVRLFNTPGAKFSPGARSTAPAGHAAAPTTSASAANAVRGTPRTGAEFAAYIQAHGDAQAKADLTAGRKVVVAVRVDTNTHANGGRGVYDDTMAVVWKGGDGQMHAQTFRGNTEPSAQYAYNGPKADKGSHTDLNGDGRADLGRLVDGNYRFARQSGSFLGNTFFEATRTQTVERDTNQDGLFNGGDPSRIDRQGAGTSMYIHQGGSNNTWSAGCQTMPDLDGFVSALGGQREFSYVLGHAN